MAYCPTCGSNVEGRFCAKCGTPIPASASQPSPPPPGAQPPPPGSGPAQTVPPPQYGSQPPQSNYAPPQQGYSAPPPGYNAPPPGYNAPPPGYNPPPPGYNPPPPNYGQPSGYPPAGAPYAASQGLQENLASALCYFPFVGWIVAIVFIVIDPYKQNRNIKFHAFQSIFLFVALMIVWIILRTIASVLALSFTFGFGLIFSMMMLILDLGILFMLLFLMYKAYNNQRVVLPVIGPLAAKQS